MSADQDWGAYLEEFHRDAPGVTERMLGRARDDAGGDPYQWAAVAVPNDGMVIDLACGSAPLADHLAHDRYLGIDLSRAELDLAVARVGSDRVVRADVTQLPITDDATDTVTCLMALMLVQPLEGVQREIRRVLRPGGMLVALLSGGAPASVADALRWGAVLAALRMPGLRWPNPEAIGPAEQWLDEAFTILSDEVRTFAYPIDDAASARQLIASLYLPDVPADRVETATRVAGSLIGRAIGIPLRRVVARTWP
ncbi:MAG: class I SAM-dependent methyltransferase [Actinobacteria bacterium]|nr:class I SAM-dependent methyltransferase [Actinomycetota bacterium]